MCWRRALYARFRSREEHSFAEKLLSAMRNGFGGHVEPSAQERRMTETTAPHGRIRRRRARWSSSARRAI